MDVIENTSQRDFAVVEASGDERGDRLFEMERVYFVESQVAVLKNVKEFSIVAAAGAKRFEGEGVVAGLTQMGEQETGQDGFADAGVGTGDEDESRLQRREFLTTDYTDGTDKNARNVILLRQSTMEDRCVIRDT